VVGQRKLIDSSGGDDAHRRRQGQHLDAMLALCETAGCRREQLLGYFGEDTSACGNCDNCLTPPETWDGTVAAQKLLSAVYRLDRERRQKFGAGHVIDILLGRATAKVTQFGHDSLSVFGIGTEMRDTQWRAVVRQLLASGLLGVESDYGALVLTPASNAVLRKERQVMLRHDPGKSAAAASAKATKAKRAEASELTSEAAGAFERLRAWRGATAKEQGVPAYVVFHDATLREIATRQPTSLAELATVSGVGETKLARYGQGVLDTLAGGSTGVSA
jgi:ATP-dependent DNA helicase RecQ